MEKTKIGSSVEDKLEAIIKVIKTEFPDMTSEKQADIVKSVVTVEIAT